RRPSRYDPRCRIRRRLSYSQLSVTVRLGSTTCIRTRWEESIRFFLHTEDSECVDADHDYSSSWSREEQRPVCNLEPPGASVIYNLRKKCYAMHRVDRTSAATATQERQIRT